MLVCLCLHLQVGFLHPVHSVSSTYLHAGSLSILPLSSISACWPSVWQLPILWLRSTGRQPLAQPPAVRSRVPCVAWTAHPACALLDRPTEHRLLARFPTSSGFCFNTDSSYNTTSTNHNLGSGASSGSISYSSATLSAMLASHSVPVAPATSSDSGSGPGYFSRCHHPSGRTRLACSPWVAL